MISFQRGNTIKKVSMHDPHCLGTFCKFGIRLLAGTNADTNMGEKVVIRKTEFCNTKFRAVQVQVLSVVSREKVFFVERILLMINL